ncbi:MAG: glycosyltransferase family 4 protein [Acidobacteriota bacterium]
MSRLALLPSEPIRPKMAGIGIRYLEMARRLPRPGLDVVLVTAGDPAEVPSDLPVADVRRFERGALAALLDDCDAVVGQGQLMNDLLIEVPSLPTMVDLYDPWLVENLSYVDTLGLDPYRNDHATWVLQMSRGDFFLCSCEEQRQFYIGFLAALGRVNPYRVADDPDLSGLIDVVPFGISTELSAHEPVLPPVEDGVRRLLFGGLYDWYDPWPVLDALETLDRPDWHLLLIRNPNPGSTPQRLFDQVESWCRQRGWWQERVKVLDWLPAARRWDLLRDVDLVVSTHLPSVETHLSLRTRFLDALAAECPVIATEGGGMSRLLREHDAGWLVPPGDPAAVATALTEILKGEAGVVQRRATHGRELLEAFTWPRVLEPVVRFATQPRRDPTKEDFAFRATTHSPPDSLRFRAKRWLRRQLGRNAS